MAGGVKPFKANTPTRVDFSIASAGDITLISGTVRHSSTGGGVEGVEILVDYHPDDEGTGKDPVAPLNAVYVTVPGMTTKVRKLLTDENGAYMARVVATGDNVAISAKRNLMFFTPERNTVSAVAGLEIQGIDFSAFDMGEIHGRVVEVDEDGDSLSLSEVIVSATEPGETEAAHADTTGATGTYILRVPYGRYNVTAEKDGYVFELPAGAIENVSVPNDGTAQDHIVGAADEANANLGYLHLSGVILERHGGRTANEKNPTHAAFKPLFDFTDPSVTYRDTVAYETEMTTVTARAAVNGADVVIDPADEDGSGSNGHQVALEAGVENVITVTVTALDETTTGGPYTVVVYRRTQSTIIEGTVTDAADGVGIPGCGDHRGRHDVDQRLG